MQETRVRFLGQEGPLVKEMATHSTILAWRIPWTEEPGRLQSMGSQGLDTTERLSHHQRYLYSILKPEYPKAWDTICSLKACQISGLLRSALNKYNQVISCDYFCKYFFKNPPSILALMFFTSRDTFDSYRAYCQSNKLNLRFVPQKEK